MPADNRAQADIDSFDLNKRRRALAEIIRETAPAAGRPPKRIDPAEGGVNMHLHSFYSYNCRGYSPTHLALACKKNGLYAAALCDFDVLEGLEEFIAAGQRLGLRVAVHLETRAFLKEYAGVEINSPGEPGVIYIMGAGFGRLPPANSGAAARLGIFRQQANRRNRQLVARINRRLPEIALDYATMVRPLSPGGCPTERHIIKAYRLKAQATFTRRGALAKYWAGLFRQPPAAVEKLLMDAAALEEQMRSCLAKRGGVGYVQPDEKTFPPVDDFMAWALSCDALPMVTWLDGASPGEKDMRPMLECLRAKGAVALNIIPDRNHNIKNIAERGRKLRKLAEVVAAARQFSFPINIGTELNKAGQPFFDDLNCAALAPYRVDFLRGANIMVGQTILSRYAGFAYCGQKAQSEFGPDLARKNAFFESVGKLAPLPRAKALRLAALGNDKAYQAIQDAARKSGWPW